MSTARMPLSPVSEAHAIPPAPRPRRSGAEIANPRAPEAFSPASETPGGRSPERAAPDFALPPTTVKGFHRLPGAAGTHARWAAVPFLLCCAAAPESANRCC